MTISKPPGTLQSHSSSVPSQSPANPNYTREPLNRTGTCNVVIFGESGAGKSSLVNLITKKDVAVTSYETKGCTAAVNGHEIWIQNETLKVKLFDTPGLDEDPRGTVPDKEARRILKKLVQSLMKQGDIHLIIYCVRGARAIQTLRKNYKFVRSQVKSKVPIVLVITSLESYEPDMEEWWRLNENTISRLGMTFAGHACVTTGMTTQSNVTKSGRNQSYDAVCRLIEQYHLSISSSKRANIVLFGQAGAGKSSLVNLMAGMDVARTSHILHWQEHPIEFDGKSYNVFDTVGLEEPRLGIPQYLDAVENAYRLIQDLERQGGIDLLLFCMRAGGLTTTLENNYRLFHEFLCDKKVPVVVVITYLENEAGEMETWWRQNGDIFREREVRVTGHACITAIQGNYPERHAQSRTTIRKVVKEFTADGQKEAWIGGDTSVSFLRKVKGFLGWGKDMVSRLKRCGMSPDVAKQLVDRIRNGVPVVEGAT
ncbi:P-loop containing nucleoside triphosphate hydrolase protein [Suillus americanus]|nr:P-loop containing nucleoside triphosphate hydrolase protein [Suillus americanus]